MKKPRPKKIIAKKWLKHLLRALLLVCALSPCACNRRVHVNRTPRTFLINICSTKLLIVFMNADVSASATFRAIMVNRVASRLIHDIPRCHASFSCWASSVLGAPAGVRAAFSGCWADAHNDRQELALALVATPRGRWKGSDKTSCCSF